MCLTLQTQHYYLLYFKSLRFKELHIDGRLLKRQVEHIVTVSKCGITVHMVPQGHLAPHFVCCCCCFVVLELRDTPPTRLCMVGAVRSMQVLWNKVAVWRSPCLLLPMLLSPPPPPPTPYGKAPAG